MNNDLATKHRPQTFEQVVGHRTVVSQLKNAMAKKAGRVFLLVGKTGAGKTTMARLIAKEVGAVGPGALVEVDAATKNSIDDMRSLQETLQYRPMGTSRSKLVIIDEAHALSKQAWTSMLKVVEEPPEGVYFVFCTTEASKVPENIRNRCISFELKAISQDDLFDLLKTVNDQEQITTSEQVLYLIAEKADGSARRALTMLAKCYGVNTRKKAAKVLDTFDGENDNDPIILLARRLIKGGMTWAEAHQFIVLLKDTNPESVRMVVLGYMGACLQSAKSEGAAKDILAVLEVFEQPYGSTNGIWPVGLSLGRLIF